MVNQNNTMGDSDMLGEAGQDMAATGVAGGAMNPASGTYVPPSAPVQTNEIAMINNKALNPIGTGSQVLNEMENKSNIPMNLRASGKNQASGNYTIS